MTVKYPRSDSRRDHKDRYYIKHRKEEYSAKKPTLKQVTCFTYSKPGHYSPDYQQGRDRKDHKERPKEAKIQSV